MAADKAPTLVHSIEVAVLPLPGVIEHASLEPEGKVGILEAIVGNAITGICADAIFKDSSYYTKVLVGNARPEAK